jgi:hypothetical protein
VDAVEEDAVVVRVGVVAEGKLPRV